MEFIEEWCKIYGCGYHYTPRNEVEGGYTGFTLFVRSLSVRPSVGRCPDDNSNSFQWIWKFFFTYITWVKILHGIEYQRPTSLNMRILADHVTYSFLAFLKSIFSCDQAALQMVFSVRLSVRLSHLFDYVPIIVSLWNFQELLPMTKVRSMQKVKVRGQRSRSQPNLAVSGL